jgi:signal transduction histidine kinase
MARTRVMMAAGVTASMLAALALAQSRGPLLVAGASLFIAAAIATLIAARRLLAVRREIATLRDERAALDAAAVAVAHDIRSPLVTVHSYLELLVQESFGPLPADARRAAERATGAAARAQSLVDETLRRHALISAARPIDALDVPVELGALIQEVVGSLEAELQAAQAHVEVRELPSVSADGGALYRIFANLLENAVKYAVPGAPPHVVISGVVEDGRCEISVRDWGMGFAPAEQQRVFDPNERGVAAHATPGAGIGLATVRELVTAQGGRVWIDPAVTDGACVRISLPAA